jgi:hypothetical protein
MNFTKFWWLSNFYFKFKKKKEPLLFDFFILNVIIFQSVFVQSYKHVFKLHSKQKKFILIFFELYHISYKVHLKLNIEIFNIIFSKLYGLI